MEMSIFYATNRTASMHEDEGSTSDRLQAILDVIARSEPLGEGGPTDIGRLRADAARAASVLIEFYGGGALERAQLIERRSPQSHFTRMVTDEIRRQGAPRRS